jgi:hypothetical protein
MRRRGGAARLGIAGALALLALSLAWAAAERDARPERPVRAPHEPARRVVAAAPPSGAALRFAGRRLGPPPPAAAPEAPRGAPPAAAAQPRPGAEQPAPPPPPARSFAPALATLEREAAGRALAGRLVDEETLEARLAALAPGPGESRRAFEERVAVERERILADEILVQQRLALAYANVVYPAGFPVASVVEAQERQLVAALPPEGRAEELRWALDHGDGVRAEPRFAPPELLSFGSAPP